MTPWGIATLIVETHILLCQVLEIKCGPSIRGTTNLFTRLYCKGVMFYSSHREMLEILSNINKTHSLLVNNVRTVLTIHGSEDSPKLYGWKDRGVCHSRIILDILVSVQYNLKSMCVCLRCCFILGYKYLLKAVYNFFKYLEMNHGIPLLMHVSVCCMNFWQ